VVLVPRIVKPLRFGRLAAIVSARFHLLDLPSGLAGRPTCRRSLECPRGLFTKPSEACSFPLPSAPGLAPGGTASRLSLDSDVLLSRLACRRTVSFAASLAIAASLRGGPFATIHHP